MRLLFTALACLISTSVFAQEETRLALVIGNENYTAGELKNPVNDALLVAQTLDSLGFDVILDTNIESKSEFIKSIREFGNKRGHYDVAFVYYAGHGIQIGSENFLLPTKEMYTSEFDVEDFGVSVQNILRYLNGVTDKVNILVLDACRNNPFEHNWNTSRSLEGGKGLAKIPPPTGSLIAFSTEAGSTAADGNELNSIYCRSLCDNMLKENISLDQVFRNVRADVLELTQGIQRPIEASQLTGQSFFLFPSNYDKQLSSAASLLNKINTAYFDDEDEIDETTLYLEVLEIVNEILLFHPESPRALLYSSQAYLGLSQTQKAISILELLIDKHKQFLEPYQRLSSLYVDLYWESSGSLRKHYLELMRKYREMSYDVDPTDKLNIAWKLGDQISADQFEEAILTAEKALLIYPDDSEVYRQMANAYSWLEDNDMAIQAFSKAIEVDPENGFLYMQLGDLFGRDLEDYDQALTYYKQANIVAHNKAPEPYYSMINCLFQLNQLDSIPLFCNKLMEFDANDPEIYYDLSKYYKAKGESYQSITYLSLAIFKKIEFPSYVITPNFTMVNLNDLYQERGMLYLKLTAPGFACNDFNLGLNYVTSLLELNDLQRQELEVWDETSSLVKKQRLLSELLSLNCLDN